MTCLHGHAGAHCPLRVLHQWLAKALEKRRSTWIHVPRKLFFHHNHRLQQSARRTLQASADGTCLTQSFAVTLCQDSTGFQCPLFALFKLSCCLHVWQETKPLVSLQQANTQDKRTMKCADLKTKKNSSNNVTHHWSFLRWKESRHIFCSCITIMFPWHIKKGSIVHWKMHHLQLCRGKIATPCINALIVSSCQIKEFHSVPKDKEGGKWHQMIAWKKRRKNKVLLWRKKEKLKRNGQNAFKDDAIRSGLAFNMNLMHHAHFAIVQSLLRVPALLLSVSFFCKAHFNFCKTKSWPH